MTEHILRRLEAVVRARQAGGNPESWVAVLTAKGLPKVRAKVLEEAGEVLEASVRLETGAGDREAVVHGLG